MSIDNNIDLLVQAKPDVQQQIMSDGAISEQPQVDLQFDDQEGTYADIAPEEPPREEVDVAMLGPVKKIFSEAGIGRREVPADITEPGKLPPEKDLMDIVPTEGKTVGKPSPTKKDKLEAEARGETYPYSEFNLNKIEGGDDLKMWIDSTAQRIGYKHEVMNMNDMADRVKGLGYSEAFLRKIVNPNTKLNADPSEVYKMMLVLNDASARSLDLAKQVGAAEKAGTLSDDLLVQFRQAVALEGAIARGVKRKQVDVARSLRAFGQARDAQIDRGFALREVLDATADPKKGIRSGKGDAIALARAMESAGSAENRLAIAEKTLGGRVKDTWMAVWINGLLSAPPTHLKNMLANTLYLGLDLTENTGRFLTSQSRKLLGSNKDIMSAKELLSDYAATIQGFREGLDMMKYAWRNNTQVTGMSKLETRSLTDPFNIGIKESDSAAMKGIKKGWGYLGKYHTWPGRALMAEDELFKGVAYRRSMVKQSFRTYDEAYEDAIKPLAEGGMGLDRKAADAYAEQKRIDFLTDPDNPAIEEAVDFAGEMTFTKQLPEGLRNFESLIQHPVLKTFFPFVRTPTNIAIALNNRVNPWSISKKAWEAFKSGDKAAMDALTGRVMAAGIIYGGVSSWAMEGRITGAGPYSNQVRKQMQEWGWQPFSFVYRKGDVSAEQLAEFKKYTTVTSGKGDYEDRYFISYAGMEPIGAITGMFATLNEYSMYEGNIDNVEEIFTASMLAASDYVSELPMVQGFTEIGELFNGTGSMSPTEATLERFKRIAEKGSEAIMGGTPFLGGNSSLFAYVNRVMSPDRRVARAEVEGYGDMPSWQKGFYDAVTRMRSRNPFTSDSVPVPLDTITGEPRDYPAPSWVMRAMPLKVTKARYSPAVDVLTAYQIAHKVTKKIDGIDLSSEQQNEIIYQSTHLRLPEYGNRTLENAILWQVNQSDFQRESRKDPINGQAMIRDIISKYYAKGREIFSASQDGAGVSVSADIKRDKKTDSLSRSIEGILQ